jgi:hypothetical protein
MRLLIDAATIHLRFAAHVFRPTQEYHLRPPAKTQAAPRHHSSHRFAITTDTLPALSQPLLVEQLRCESAIELHVLYLEHPLTTSALYNRPKNLSKTCQYQGVDHNQQRTPRVVIFTPACTVNVFGEDAVVVLRNGSASITIKPTPGSQTIVHLNWAPTDGRARTTATVDSYDSNGETRRPSIHWAHPIIQGLAPARNVGNPSSILRFPRTQAANSYHLTPLFILAFEFRGKTHSFTFGPMCSGVAHLVFFEKRIVEAVDFEDKLAVVKALHKGYSLEYGFWGRTIRRPIRREAVDYPQAAFNTFLNSIRPDQTVTIV